MAKNILTQDQSDMKLANLLTIFHLLRDHTPISRADLAKLSGMSPTSITRFVTHMQAVNLLQEAPSETKKVGRTATMLRINAAAFYSVGIHIDSTYIHVSILNFLGKVVADRHEKQHFSAPSLPQVLDVAHRLYLEAMEQADLKQEQICGIGLSVIGVIRDSAILEFTPQFNWHGLDLRQAIREKFRFQNVVVENDCNAAIVGQCVLNPAYRKQDIACLCIGSGVGAAVSFQGKLFCNPRGMSSAEIGHTVVEPNGMLCDCGNRGCLQTFLAEGALVQRAQAHDPTVTGLADIHRAWQNRVPWALDLIQTACTYAKIGINHLACSYNPECILIGGESIDTYWDMFGAILEEPQLLFEPLKQAVQILPFFQMPQASLIGVCQQVQENHLVALLKSTL